MFPPNIRIGTGFDIHPISTDLRRRFILGGVEVSPSYGPLGHSDADVVCHAISDAILGAAGLGGLGDHFPDSDEELKDVSSVALLRECMTLVSNLGWGIINCDVTVIVQKPKLAPYLVDISKSVTGVIGAPTTVKAKSPEEIGSLGQNLGVAALASALLWQA